MIGTIALLATLYSLAVCVDAVIDLVDTSCYETIAIIPQVYVNIAA